MNIYRKLFPYLKPHLTLLSLAWGCMVISSLLEGISLWMLVPLLDVVVLKGPLKLPGWFPPAGVSFLKRFQELDPVVRLHLVIGTVAALFLLKAITQFSQATLMNDVSLRFLRNIREGLYRQYLRLSLDFFSDKRSGELLSRITYDVSVIQNTITEGVTDLVYQSARVVVLTFLVFIIDWRLALVALVLLPAVGYPILRIGKALRKLGLLAQQRMADLTSHLIETLQGIRIIKAFTAEAKEEKIFSEINQQYYKANVKTVKRQEALSGVTELIAMVGALVALEIGGRAVLRGELSFGTIATFLAALLSLNQPFKRLSRLHSINQQALTAARRVVDILDTRPSVVDPPQAKAFPGFHREIRFEGVWFQYDERPILRGMDLSIQKGEIVAIVGHSGCGKTTLVNLIPRFYDPTKGKIAIDGVDLKTIGLSFLREQIGIVTQEPFLFHDTIRANIAFGRPSASEEEIMKAARAANADSFIRRFPKGYDASVGDLGGRLSGGERQRVAIARALLKDPPILILDEATSQLDSESEALVQEALERLMAGRTVFVIAHRLSTIRHVDRIIVLDEGRIAEAGSHEELLKDSALYRRLYELQVAP